MMKELSMTNYATSIKPGLMLFLIALTSYAAFAARPMPTEHTRAAEMKAVYSDSAFVGFKTKYLGTMEEMTEAYNSFYDNFILPYVEYALAENDTVFVIDKKYPKYADITIHSTHKNLFISVSQADWGDKIKELPIIPEKFRDGCELPSWSQYYVFYSTIFEWDEVEVYNMFFNSIIHQKSDKLDGFPNTIYRIVKKGNDITEYTSISYNANPYWSTRNIGLGFDKARRKAADKALKATRPTLPEKIENTTYSQQSGLRPQRK